ncbi:chaoptin [Oratosquilla oratoria]|uniref:chaoptin n=1 Tax=Oratosquilla oratoria TaxID=337810 RepID=UPI003F7692EB
MMKKQRVPLLLLLQRPFIVPLRHNFFSVVFLVISLKLSLDAPIVHAFAPPASQMIPCSFNMMCSCRLAGTEGKSDRTPGFGTGGMGGDRIGGPGGIGGAGGIGGRGRSGNDIHGMGYDMSSTSRFVEKVSEVSCVGVPFARIPVIPSGLILQLDLVNSGLEVIQDGDFGDVQVENMRLMSNNIRHIADKTFSGMGNTLQSLDLSNNELTAVPRKAFGRLSILEWLNLHSNHIPELLEEDWDHFHNSLITVFLSENDIDIVPRKVFSRCRRLLWLNLESNNILKLESDSLSKSIQTLGLSHNLLYSFPSDAISNIHPLSWLFLRGNLIDRLPEGGFAVKKILDRLDLGENFIRFIPDNLFNNTLTVRDLHLDFNLLTELQDEAFKGLNPGRLYLSANNIFNISDKAFLGGPQQSLVMLDLEKNSLDTVPKALSQLKNLRYLYLPDNKIKEVPEDSLRAFCETLEALSLSGNFLKAIPRYAFENCSTIAHLNLGHNRISEINEEDFETWGDNLDTLVLRNNQLKTIPPHAFRATPKLRELSLSFNRINDISSDSLIDVLNTLEILEISFGFYRDDFPEEVLKPLTSLQWIALDNNNFRTITETALYSFGELQYFNMDSNRLTHIPKTLFHQNVHKNLGDIRLAYNSIRSLDIHTFHNLEGLRTLVLNGNQIETLKFEALKALPKLVTVLLADNKITHIEDKAFADLPNLMKLELQQNKLHEFSLSMFVNVTSPSVPLALNISYNEIVHLTPGNMQTPLEMKSLDVSHNKVKEVPHTFLQSFTHSLQRLDMGYNRITKLDVSAFGTLERLQMLILEHNNIQEIRHGALRSINKVQFMDLSHNHIENLPPECFSDVAFLRVLDLSHNHLRSLPGSAFRGTLLETLKLSHNEFVTMPAAGLSEVERTLHYLDISNNHLEHLDSTMFYSFSNLIELNLASNKLTILPDNVFESLINLISLDLSGNPVRANFKELFHYTHKVQKLNLANIGFSSSPIIPLPNLIHLNLSSNLISEVEVQSIENLRLLRGLDLSHNKITHTGRIWPFMPYLKYLDLSHNPIQSLTKDSFVGATRIETLKLNSLDLIKRFDTETLSHMKFLSELFMNTFPHIEKYRFRVGHLLANVHTLQKLHLEVRENALTDQLSGAFGPKLKELHITGNNLKAIDSKTFRGFQNKHELLLSITGTSIQSLPDGLLTHLSDVAYLSLDLRNNKLHFLNSHVLYDNGTDWETKGTTFVAGGLALQGNEWTCDCSLVWLGRWLRRWLRETLQIHTAMIKGAQQVHQLARQATCHEPKTGQQVPLLDLHSEDLGCHARLYSDSGARVSSAPLGVVVPGLASFLLLAAWHLLAPFSSFAPFTYYTS